MHKSTLLKIDKSAFLEDKKVNRRTIFNNQRLLKIGQAAKLLGVSIDSLRRWERSRKLVPIKTPGGTRYYSTTHLKNFNPSYKTTPNSLNPLKISNFKLPKVFPITVSLIITLVVALAAIMAVYLAIPPNDSYLSSSTIKPAVQLASAYDMDNANLNQNATILKAETTDLIEEANLAPVTDSTISDSPDSWTLTSEDCIKGVIERGI